MGMCLRAVNRLPGEGKIFETKRENSRKKEKTHRPRTKGNQTDENQKTLGGKGGDANGLGAGKG